MTQLTDQELAEFEAWAASIGFSVTGRYAETVDVLCAKSAFKAGYQAARRAQVVPHGWKLVPVEPTMEMVASGDKSHKASSWLIGGANAVPATYAAMLAAAPQPPYVTEQKK